MERDTNGKLGAGGALAIHDDLGRLIGYLTRTGIVRVQPRLN